MEEFRTPLSRAEAILENILGAENELQGPLSNVEEILLSILNDTPYTKEPETLIEEMLLAIKEGTEMDAIAKNRVEEILLAIIHGEEYTKLPLSRFEELLIEWLKESAVTEKFLDFAPILSFSDSAGKPLVKCKVKVEPVQDLHGYDNPWPAGGGKNKFGCADGSYAVGSTRTVTVTSGVWSYKVNSTARSSVFLPEATVTAMNIPALKAGTYTFSLVSNAAVSSVIAAAVLNLSDGQAITNGNSFTISSDTSVVSITTPSSGQYAVGTYTCQIQIESGTTATAYEPYSNICPISGHDSVSVVRCGKNLLDADAYYSDYKQNDGSYLAKGNEITTIYIQIPSVLLNQQLSFSAKLKLPENSSLTNARVRAIVDGVTKFGQFVNTSDYLISSVTFTPMSTNDTVSITYGSNGANYLQLKDVQLELGSTATDYEPYQGETYQIELGDTIYGGERDVTTGKLTANLAMVDLGTLNWTARISGEQNRLYSSSLPQAYVPSYSLLRGWICDTYAENSPSSAALLQQDIDSQNIGLYSFRSTAASTTTLYLIVPKTASPTGKLVYELATLIEIQLTPQQITTLLGGNTLYADTGDISVKYLAKKS